MLTFLFFRGFRTHGTDSLQDLGFLTQESCNVIVDFISISSLVKLQVDVRAEIILSTEHLKALGEETRTQTWAFKTTICLVYLLWLVELTRGRSPCRLL